SIVVQARRNTLYNYVPIAHTGDAVGVMGRTTFGLTPSQLDVTFAHLGRGPSVNNLGMVAFTGTSTIDGLEYQSIYSADTTQTQPLLRRLLNEFDMMPSDNDLTPSQRFSDFVQVNDENKVLAWRNLTARMLITTCAGIIPVLSSAYVFPMPLTYLETWDAASAGSFFSDS